MRHPCLWYLSVLGGCPMSNVHSNHNPHHWLTPLSISVKYKSLEKTILGQVYGKVLSFFITPSLCLLLWWWWQKSAFCPVVRSLPSTPCFHFNTPRLTYPGTRKNFFKREALLPFSTLQNSTFSSYYALLDCWGEEDLNKLQQIPLRDPVNRLLAGSST